jgi:NADPH2:quinone reductase
VPQHSTIYFYGFLSGRVPISIATSLLMWKNLVMKPFSNFESATVEDSQTLDAALADLQALIDDELFKTRIGREFRFDEIDAAMRFETAPDAKTALTA